MFDGILPMALPSTPVGLKPDLQVVLVVYFCNRHLVLRPGAAHG